METQINESPELEEQMPELTPEQQAAQEKFFRGFVIKKNAYHLRSIFNYLHGRKITLQDILEEINQKKCGLSALQRDFMRAFKLDFIDQLLLDMYGDYYRASDVVEESAGRSEVDGEQTAHVSGFSVGPVDQEDAGSGAQSDQIG